MWMKIEMYVYGGNYIIPTIYKPVQNLMNNCIFIECDSKQLIEICKSQSIRRRWNKIDIQVPNQIGIKPQYSFDYLYNSNFLETEVVYYYKEQKSKTEIKLVICQQQKYCSVSSIGGNFLAI